MLEQTPERLHLAAVQIRITKIEKDPCLIRNRRNYRVAKAVDTGMAASTRSQETYQGVSGGFDPPSPSVSFRECFPWFPFAMGENRNRLVLPLFSVIEETAKVV